MSFDAFNKTTQSWEGIPVIFARDHPDMTGFDTNPTTELARIDGRVVGSVFSPDVVQSGAPSLRANLGVTDPEVNAMIDEGKISLSTGFRATKLGDEDITNVRPHHVLLFVENEIRGDMPRDLGTAILNKETAGASLFASESREPRIEVINMTGAENDSGTPGKLDKILDALAEFKNMLSGKDSVSANEADGDITNVTNKETDKTMSPDNSAEIEALNKQVAEHTASIDVLNKQIAEKDSTIASKDSEIESLNKRIADLSKFKADQEWLEVKNKFDIPAGLLDNGGEAELRKLKAENPDAFYNKIFDAKAEADKLASKDAEGEEFANKPTTKPRGYGQYDFVSHTFKGSV